MRLLMVIIVLFFALPVQAAEIDYGARILTYKAIGQDETPEESVTVEQFQTHMALLSTGGYQVWPLDKIIQTIVHKQKFPDKVVGISFDGAHSSLQKYAAPLLNTYDFPYTVFVPVEAVHRKAQGTMHWRDLQRLAQTDRVTFGLHSDFKGARADQNPAAIRQILNNDTARFQEKLGMRPEFLSIADGDISADEMDILNQYGFKAHFGQAEYPLSSYSHLKHLPRFLFTENKAKTERFENILSSLPLPVADAFPQISRLKGQNLTAYFTLKDNNTSDPLQVSCHDTTSAPMTLTRLGQNHIALRWVTTDDTPLASGQMRVTCLAPSSIRHEDDKKKIRDYWFGFLFYWD